LFTEANSPPLGRPRPGEVHVPNEPVGVGKAMDFAAKRALGSLPPISFGRHDRLSF
jgi:hypothetical protein